MTDKKDILKGIYEKGFHYEKNNHGCGQCTIAALQDYFEIDDIVFKSASAFAGSLSTNVKGFCGAFCGGIMAINYFFGREKADFDNPEAMDNAKALAKEFKERFMEKYDGLLCEQVQKKIMGRAFNLTDPDEKMLFIEAGAYVN